MAVLSVISYLVYSFFVATILFTLFFSITAKLKKGKQLKVAEKKATIAILIPAYKEDEVIISVSEQMMTLDYPAECYTVFVIADQLKDKTIESLKSIGVNVVPVSFEKSTKAKSLNYCLDKISPDDFDMVLISDADNILSKNFLSKINNAFQAGYHVIQGRRVAKNLDSNYAVLDGASEIINNHIFRKGPNAVGLSASLIGSGMAFATTDIKEALSEIKAIGGFDKVLQLNVIEKGHTILYMEDAIIYDEKVSDSDNFKNQRKRWLASQYIYLAKFSGRAFAQLFRGNFDYFNIAVLHNLFLPRVLNLGLLPILSIAAFFVNPAYMLGDWPWVSLFGLYIFAMLLALPGKFYNRNFLRAILSLPGAFFNMFMLLFKLKGADKTFIHTKHSKTSVDNSLFSVDDQK